AGEARATAVLVTGSAALRIEQRAQAIGGIGRCRRLHPFAVEKRLADSRIEFLRHRHRREEAGNQHQSSMKRRHVLAKYPIMPVSRCSNMSQWNIHLTGVATKAISMRSLWSTRTVSA